MTLRKRKIDSSEKHIAQSEQTQSVPRDIKPNATKNNSLLRKQNKKTHKIIKNVFQKRQQKVLI